MTSTDQLNIYHLSRVIPAGTFSIGEMIECVVIAVSEQHARRLAAQDCRDEGSDAWFESSSKTSAVLVGTAITGSRPRVVCTDVHEG